MSYNREDTLIELMATCIEEMLAGASVAACLERHPEYADALAALLNTVSGVHELRHVPLRSATVAAQRRAEFLKAARAAQPAVAKDPLAQLAAWWAGLVSWVANTPRAFGLPRTMPAGLAAMLVIALLSGLLLTGMVTASASALPGDVLYPIKLSAEHVQVALTFNPTTRAELLAEQVERRISEAKAVVKTGRRVIHVPLQGVIELIAGDTWQVSGLTVQIATDSQIVGQPVLGAQVAGRASAPGDGSLVLRYAELEAPAQPIVPPPPTATPAPSATPTRPGPTATSTQPIPTDLPAVPAGSDSAARPGTITEPTDAPTPEPPSTATPTATATTTPTATTTRTATPTQTWTPAPPREHVRGRIIGFVERVEGSWWTVNGVTIETNAQTVFIGNPRVGSKVDVVIEILPNGAAIGLTITETQAPDGPPEPLEFTDVIQAINGAAWTIGSFTVQVAGDTVLENNPGVGDLVSVKAERHASGEIRALRITAIRDIVVYLSGIIETMAGDTWQIGGYPVIVAGDTTIIGEAIIGAQVQVQALQLPDGRLVAQIIVVVAPPATTTPTATAAAAAVTPTETPTSTETAQLSATATTTPVATGTLISEETATPTATWMPSSARPEPPTVTETTAP